MGSYFRYLFYAFIYTFHVIGNIFACFKKLVTLDLLKRIHIHEDYFQYYLFK